MWELFWVILFFVYIAINFFAKSPFLDECEKELERDIKINNIQKEIQNKQNKLYNIYDEDNSPWQEFYDNYTSLKEGIATLKQELKEIEETKAQETKDYWYTTLYFWAIVFFIAALIDLFYYLFFS